MKGIKKGIAILLVFCTLLGMVAMTGAAAPQTEDTAEPMAAGGNEFLRIFSLDCGRIYFSETQIKDIIDALAQNDYTHLQLAFGNGGLRFLLDDMTVGSYDSDTVQAAVQAGNTDYAAHDGHKNSSAAPTWLTEFEMNDIITYAREKGIEIIPLFNSPGHLNAVVYAMGQLGIENAGYPLPNGESSRSTVNLDNAVAVDFAKALIQKYITYFAAKGCKYFHLGADEFANDPTDSTKVGFVPEIKERFVGYVNSVAGMASEKGMTPLMFNDGYAWSNAGFAPELAVSYWTNGAVSSGQIAAEGHRIINTNQNWYYVLGEPFGTGDNWCSYARATNGATNTQVTQMVDGGSVPADKLIGATMCFWCDFTNYSYTPTEQARVRTLISTLAKRNPTYFAPMQEKEITVMVGQTVHEAATNTELTEQPDANIAQVTVGTAGSTTYTYTPASYVSGGQYLLVNKQKGGVLTPNAAKDGSTNGLACVPFDQAADLHENTWTVSNNMVRSVKTNGYIQINTASKTGQAQNVSTTSSGNTLNINKTGTDGTEIVIYNRSGSTNTYLDGYNESFAGGWSESGVADNRIWKLYKVDETTTTSPSLDITGVHEGTTYATVGNTRYTIHVIPEALGSVGLNYNPWISNLAIYPEGQGAENCSGTEGAARTVTISAATPGVYSERGTEFANLVAPTGDFRWEGDGIQTCFWKGTILGEGKHQDGTGNTDKDMSMSGTNFVYLRYWGGEWSYSANRESWTPIQATDEVCAYYLQKTAVTDEVDTYVKDWALTTGNAASQPENRCQKALSFAVVYPNGQMRPGSERDIYTDSTLIYWANLDPLTFIRVGVNDVYDVEKITYTMGARQTSSSSNLWGSNDSIKWNTKTVDGTTWYDETTCWDESRNTEPVVNGADLTSSIYAGKEVNTNTGDHNGTWGTDDAVLILIYLKPVVTEDSLHVQYWDDSANAQIHSYPLNIRNESTGEAGTFLNRLEQNSEVHAGAITLDDEAYVENAKGVHEGFTKDLTKIPSLMGKYSSGLYEYTGADISGDGKTLTLHYNLNTEKLSKSFVLDFGLPVKVTLSDLGITNAQNVSKVQASVASALGTVTVNGDNSITFQPGRVMTGVVPVTVTATYKNGDVSTFPVGFCPATTVYYEETFATNHDDWESSTAVTGTQRASSAGSKANYGYDSAYDNVLADNGCITGVPGDATASFSFTGTGVTVYANCTQNTGTVMVALLQNGSVKKLVTVDTRMKDGDSEATAGQAVNAYNVPIVSLTGLARGEYEVQLKPVLTKNDDGKVAWPVSIDGFRVFGTLDVDHTQAYGDDGEASPVYGELRNAVLAGLSVSADVSTDYAEQIALNAMSQVYATAEGSNGALIVEKDGNGDGGITVQNPQDLLDNGPKNELYLQPGQSVVFKLAAGYQNAQVGLKALNAAVKYMINGASKDLASGTDMFYPVGNTGTVTITNTGNGVLSITLVKAFRSDVQATAMFAPLTADDLVPALMSLGYKTEPVQADAVLTIAVQAGSQTLTTTLTASGTEGESHTFTAAEIRAAAEQVALPEGYTLDGVTFEDVTVQYGVQGGTSVQAVQTQAPTPEPQPTLAERIMALAKELVRRFLSGWHFGA